MKEFTSQTGGRFTYVDDILNLQELALAFSALFDDAGDFIVSGCIPSGNKLTSGIVWLNGKLRVVEETSNITQWPVYIYEDNSTETTPYQSGEDKVGRNVWGAKVGRTVPTENTPLTNEPAKAIVVTTVGAPSLKDIWFGKYALLRESSTGWQYCHGTVDFDTINVKKITASNYLKIVNGSKKLNLLFQEADAEISYENTNGKMTRMLVKDDGSFEFYSGSSLIATISDNAIEFKRRLIADPCQFGVVTIDSGNIFNSVTPSDRGVVAINVRGYNSGFTYGRTTNIGDGKGHVLLAVKGSESVIEAQCPIHIAKCNGALLTLQSSKAKTDATLQSTVTFSDSGAEVIAKMGFDSATDTKFYIRNIIGDIKLISGDIVDLGPKIAENGTLLSNKYVTRTMLGYHLDQKADRDLTYEKREVYNRTECDSKFALKGRGLSQFASSSSNVEALCAEIGAATTKAVEQYAVKEMLLSDMAANDTKRAKIRENIKAASLDDVKDSGWRSIDNCPSLFVRQIGKIVSVQGKLTPGTTSGNIWFLPNDIGKPYRAVSATFTNNNGKFSMGIGTDGSINAIYCDAHLTAYDISLTYMV